MQHVIFSINPSYSQEKALEELLSHGLEHPYILEELTEIKIGGFLDILPPFLKRSTLIEASQGIDWDKEWKTHSPYYKNGLLEIDLNTFGAQLKDPFIRLTPGPGFGDLSHPTTHLMLEWMVSHVPNKHVLDIGCGSGILSLAAHKLGALSVHGIDIDPEALKHSRKNALLNYMENILFSEVYNNLNIKDLVILINMTFYEQKEVFKTYPSLEGTFITSGILDSQITPYIEAFPYSYTQIYPFHRDSWVLFIISN